MEDTLFYSSIPFLVIALIGNLLVIQIVHKTKEMQTLIDHLLAGMAFEHSFEHSYIGNSMFEFSGKQ